MTTPSAANRKHQAVQHSSNTTKLYKCSSSSNRKMKILLTIATGFCLFNVLQAQVEHQSTSSQQQNSTTPTTEAPTTREDTNKMTTITIFKIQKQALLNNTNSSSAGEEQSWLIDQADLKQTTSANANNSDQYLLTTSTSTSTTTASPPVTVTPTAATAVTSSKAPPVLRPSIEEVASKLSRKHLNLQHDNWRLKQQSSQQQTLFDDSVAKSDGASPDSPPLAVEAEQDVAQVSSAPSSPTDSSSLGSVVFSPSSSSAAPKLSEGHHREHYLHIDQAAATISQPKSRQLGRRKKTGSFFTGEAYEMSQCHQYLRIYNAPSSAALNGAPTGFYQMISNQQLPCTCEMRTSSGLEISAISTSWLSCDYVQLIGGYLHPHHGASSNLSGDTWDMGKVSANSANEGLVQVTRFSQRNAGLQTLHAQKFLNLQLSNLKSIDLSDNRIRQIKMDAFHGLETSLEQLNLANNLLGDSRAITGYNQNAATTTSKSKLIFFTDEFNRLKKLKWLSLRNNRINQLSSTIFTKPSQHQVSFIQQDSTGKLSSLGDNSQDATKTQTTGELVYLDLSENILKTVPSEAISELNQLQTLNLRGNKLIQLDQSSKFPKSLKYLDLSENLIKIIRHCDLIDLPDLIELNLSHNQLSQLDKTAFLSSTATPAAAAMAAATNSLQAAQQLQNVDAESSLSSSQSNNLIVSNAVPASAATKGSSSLLSQLLASGDDHDEHSSLLPAALDGMNEEGESSLLDQSQHADSLSLLPSADESEGGRMRRRRRDVVSGNREDEIVDDVDDLDADESAPQQQQQQTNQQTLPADDQATRRRQREFNSTIRLNLAYNYFTNLPGDSLLRFPNLQQLDISYNRIRYLDSNYLCSIYNLVESLRELDLSGNLLALPQTNNNSSPAATKPTGEGATEQQQLGNERQLNKLFGCLQKLERLSLATNRPLSSANINHANPKVKQQDEISSMAAADQDDQEFSSRADFSLQPDRLHIKFGDNYGSRHLNQLDLSDNQLRTMPLIEQVFQQPIATMILNNKKLTNGNSTTDQQQHQLNQWMASRVYLVSLNLSHNYIDRLEERDFDHLFSLRHLTFDFNRLSSLPTKLMRKFTSLDRASFEGNRLGSLDSLNELFERSIRTLRYLNLANNRLTIWPAVNKVLYENPLRQPALQLDSEDKQALALQFALEELNLRGNLFTSANVSTLFDQFAYMKSLRILDLSHNLLNRVRSEWFKFANHNLRTLTLTGNKINSIDLGSFAYNQLNELQHLDLAHNLLKELKRKTFDSLPKLKDLDLSHNFIHTINSETFNQMIAMQTLNLSNNKLTSWKCEYFSNLCNSISGNINADLYALLNVNVQAAVPSTDGQERQPVSALIDLDLSHNSLSQLRVNSISVHTKLERLNLAHNKLSYIPHDLFKANILDSKTGKQIQLVSSLKYLNLAHNRIQTVDNINLRPLRNLINFDLSHNELQTLGVDVILVENNASGSNQRERNIVVSNNVTNLLIDQNNPVGSDPLAQQASARQSRMLQQQQGGMASGNGLPALGKLRHLNLSHNQLTQVNQSLLHELSPFVLLNLDLSHNYLESELLPYGFYAKISGQPKPDSKGNYDLVFTLKLESLDLSHNRLNEFPADLLENHHISMESCNLAHNRIQTLVPNSNILIQIKSLNLEFNPLNRESNELILFEHKSARHLNLAATRLYAIKEVSNLADKTLQQQSAHKQRIFANQTSQLDLIRSISKPIDAPYVQHLNLSSNQLVWLAANIFERMHSLQTLDLSNNQLTRLHLLTNQLSPLAASLESLNLASNLFTGIDSTDFSQLSRLRHLDLSSLLSLQKLNCRFLSKLTTLESLRLFNFPQVRQNLNNILANLQLRRQQQKQQQDSHGSQDRIIRKLQQELLMSTLGRHCFRDEASLFSHQQESNLMSEPSKWFNLQVLELELFSAFEADDSLAIGKNLSGAFQLQDELTQFIGPETRRLTLFGLNLTNLAEDSLLGITSPHLDLKISYTSLTRLPLEQVLDGISKRTKLNLDFRNNNIQSLDVRTLQVLDELQLNHQILQEGDHSSLRLAFNPMRCDCQTRPLWLWLNQRWANTEPSAQQAEDQADQQGVSANYWLKFSSISQTSDIKCYYPMKLRGKLAQYVNYQDLVCKGSSAASFASNQAAPSRQSRKRNDTRELSYYSKESGDIYEDIDSTGEMGSTDYLDSSSDQASDAVAVRVTKFNRFPSVVFNQTVYYLQNIPVPFILDNQPGKSSTDEELEFELDSLSSVGRMGKRDGNSVPIYPILHDLGAQPRQILNTQYSRHRPNTQQRHSSFDTLSTLKQFQPAHHHSSGQKQTLLTESDVYILTIMSIAMSIMSFVIITVCLFKYKMDRSDKERILTDHSKMLMSQALFDLHQHQQSFKPKHSSSSGSNNSSSKKLSSSGSSSDSSSRRKQNRNNKKGTNDNNKSNNGNENGEAIKRVHIPPIIAHKQQAQLRNKQQQDQILVQLRDSPPTAMAMPAAAQNFLMRSPTIRRMQGLATNASDWFKYTLRAYPANTAMHRGQRRRRLFLGDTVPVASQLTTGKRGIEEQLASNEPGSPATLAVGCPHHAFKAVDKLRREGPRAQGGVIEEKCLHCARLLATIQQTKVQYVIGGSSQQKEQQARAQKDSETDNFVPPSVIRALAEQLDQANAESNYVALGPEWLQSQRQQQQERHQRNELETSSFYKRGVRSMRTFGVGSTDEERRQQQLQQLERKTEVEPREESQIPSVDVVGRFAYQSDSQVDTPTPYDARCSSMLGGSSQMDGSEDTNGHYNKDGVFILIPDGSSADGADHGDDTNEEDEQEPVSVLLNENRKQANHLDRLTDQQEETIRMQDECSHSSSPVAYGFMRNSGPSSLASSRSVAREVQQQHINLYQSDSPNHHYFTPTSTSTSNNNNNNNIDNYSVIRKKTNSSTTTTNEQQVIISRL